MTYQEPKTWLSNDRLTEANLNTWIRDQQRGLKDILDGFGQAQSERYSFGKTQATVYGYTWNTNINVGAKGDWADLVDGPNQQRSNNPWTGLPRVSLTARVSTGNLLVLCSVTATVPGTSIRDVALAIGLQIDNVDYPLGQAVFNARPNVPITLNFFSYIEGVAPGQRVFTGRVRRFTESYWFVQEIRAVQYVLLGL